MQKWWKKLGFIAGGLVSIGGLASPAWAQAPGSCPVGISCSGGIFGGGQQPMGGPGPMCAPQAQPGCGAPPVSLPNDGTPNGFTDWENPCTWRRPLVSFAAEGMVGITRRAPLNVPLATTSTAPNPSTDVGAIGEPSTVIVAGFGGIDLRNPSGMRLTLGVSPTPEWMVPIEAVYLSLHERTTVFAGNSDITGNPLLARPVLATQPGQAPLETVYLSSFPTAAVGGINIQSSINYWGVQVQGVVLTNLQWGDDYQGLAVSFPIGLRMLNLEDDINITSTTTSINPTFALPFVGGLFGPGSRTVVTDLFKTNNEFRGGEIGVRFEGRWDRFSVTAEPRVDIGSNRQNVTIEGISTLNPLIGPNQTAPGGILAVSTNGGSHVHERFTVIPEGNLNLGYDLFPWLTFQIGYTIAYWPNVVRAGDQINRSVDVRQIPTDQSFAPGPGTNNLTGPFFSFHDSNFLIQGVSLGLVFSF